MNSWKELSSSLLSYLCDNCTKWKLKQNFILRFREAFSCESLEMSPPVNYWCFAIFHYDQWPNVETKNPKILGAKRQRVLSCRRRKWAEKQISKTNTVYCTLTEGPSPWITQRPSKAFGQLMVTYFTIVVLFSTFVIFGLDVSGIWDCTVSTKSTRTLLLLQPNFQVMRRFRSSAVYPGLVSFERNYWGLMLFLW